jgi:hypothetical protein
VLSEDAVTLALTGQCRVGKAHTDDHVGDAAAVDVPALLTEYRSILRN